MRRGGGRRYFLQSMDPSVITCKFCGADRPSYIAEAHCCDGARKAQEVWEIIKDMKVTEHTVGGSIIGITVTERAK